MGAEAQQDHAAEYDVGPSASLALPASPASVDPDIQGDISTGAWSAKCFPVPSAGQESAIDPIKNWGSTAPHVHEFFAPTVVNATMSPGYLLNLPNTAVNCQGPTAIPTSADCTYSPPSGVEEVCDKSAYWVPELVWDTAPRKTAVQPSPLAPDFMNIYWRNEYTDPQLDSPFPEDFAIVAGNAMATTPQNYWVINWECVAPGSAEKVQTPGRYSPVIPSSCDLPSDQVCPPGGHCYPVYLRLVVTFPECVELATNPTQGMETPIQTSYNITASPTPPVPTPGGGGYYNCQSSNYLQIPPIQVDPHWLINRAPNSAFVPASTITSVPPAGGPAIAYLHFDLSNLLLSSDMVMDRSLATNLPPGTTSHADYENGYRQADIDGLIALCFHSHVHMGGMNCGAI